MNEIHAAIVSHIREVNKAQDNPVMARQFDSLTDEEFIRQMFLNYRGSRGLRLTKFGVMVMQRYFKGYEIKVPEVEEWSPKYLTFLDQKSKMPYYCDKKMIVMFDHVLGVKLRLVDGMISILMEIEE
jgi:hypothetical protein